MSSSGADYSLLLWSLGALIHGLGSHVFLGALRDARREPGLAFNWPTLLIAGLAIGGIASAGMVVALTGNTAFALGFQIALAAGLLAGSLVAGLAVAFWLGLASGWVATIGAALLLAASTIAVQQGWLDAAGFRPGIARQPAAIGGAAAIVAVGALVALRLAFSEGALFSRVRNRFRLAATGLLTLTLIGAQELLIAGARVGTQVGSVFQNQLPAPLLSLFFGAVVPLLLTVAALDLGSSRRRRRLTGPGGPVAGAPADGYPPGSSTSASGARRRRRRHRIRSL